MEAYARALNVAIPFFILLIVIEAVAAWRMGKKVNRSADVISSLSSGITNTVKDILGLSVTIISYGWLVKHVAIAQVEASWALYVIGFFALDLAGYWMHRWNHEINFLWNRHIIHHSSEDFNLACALRQSISEIFNFFSILLIPAALFGVPVEVIAVLAPLHLFAQFWYHTRLIGKMGFLESFLVTPSHHRVHHAMNTEYLDKNYGQVFIFWDRWFGTFQEELPDVPPVYGVKKPVRTWNPILINFQHNWLLFKDFCRTRSLWDKLRLWFMPTGWRPQDVAEKYPVQIVTDFSTFEKYDTKPSPPLTAWSWAQLILALGFMFHLINNLGDIGLPGVLYYGAFLFLGIFSYTTLLDKSALALPVEIGRAAFGFGLIWWQSGDWFGLNNLLPGGANYVAGYLVISLLGTMWFSRKEVQPLTVRHNVGRV